MIVGSEKRPKNTEYQHLQALPNGDKISAQRAIDRYYYSEKKNLQHILLQIYFI